MNDTHKPEQKKEVTSPVGLITVVLYLLLVLLQANTLQIVIETSQLAQSFLSPSSLESFALHVVGGEYVPAPDGSPILLVSFLHCLIIVVAFTIGPVLVVGLKGTHSRIRRLGCWWALPGLWGIGWIAVLVTGSTVMTLLLQVLLVFLVSVSIAGTVYECQNVLLIRHDGHARISRSVPIAVWVGIGLYVLIFVAMNWGLWFNLRIPHGDSAMYEEHLWNLLHGKGFRSYLDQGLFWGEHIQCIHLLLIPLYLIWPSHLLLEFSESFALAIGAIPVYWIAYRASGNRQAAVLLGLTYLCYFPLQFLDIAIDLKTFRPIAFGIPVVLFAIDQWERKHYWSATLLLVLSLTAKEDYAIVVFSLGLSLLIMYLWNRKPEQDRGKKAISFGLGYLLTGPVYLFAALKAIRWFRSGVEVHYAGYFSRFGESTSEIIWTMLTNPLLLFQELATIDSLMYALVILVPLAFLPLFSPLRLLSCAPMFVLLCLNELARDPRHHFHAPLLPLVFWAAAHGLANLMKRWKSDGSQEAFRWSQFALCTALATGLWFSLSPLGVAFWDTGSQWHAGRLYFPDRRAEEFHKIKNLIPKNSRVASTDFVHPRYTHFERSYDYSNYARQVAGNSTNVPADTDYIVIDTQHPYSEIKEPGQIRELRLEPERWELLPDQSAGYFLILKRRQ